jgi:hypothetical protein
MIFDYIIFLWEWLRLLSNVAPDCGRWYASQNPKQEKVRRLERIWVKYKNNSRTERCAAVEKLLNVGELVAEYLEERDKFENQVSRRGRKRHGRVRHPHKKYPAICFPEDHKEARDSKFGNMIQLMEPWARLNRRYGQGIIVFVSLSIPEEQ